MQQFSIYYDSNDTGFLYGKAYNHDLPMLCSSQGMQNFGGIRVGNGPTEDEAEIIQHDQLAQNVEEEPEVRARPLCFSLSSPVFSTVWVVHVCSGFT